MSQVETQTNGWKEVSGDYTSSTVAYFERGQKCVTPVGNAQRGDEVLVWRGISLDGNPETVDFEGHEDIPEGTTYLVNTKFFNQDVPVNSEYASDLAEVETIVEQETEKVNKGVYEKKRE